MLPFAPRLKGAHSLPPASRAFRRRRRERFEALRYALFRRASLASLVCVFRERPSVLQKDLGINVRSSKQDAENDMSKALRRLRRHRARPNGVGRPPISALRITNLSTFVKGLDKRQKAPLTRFRYLSLRLNQRQKKRVFCFCEVSQNAKFKTVFLAPMAPPSSDLFRSNVSEGGAALEGPFSLRENRPLSKALRGAPSVETSPPSVPLSKARGKHRLRGSLIFLLTTPKHRGRIKPPTKGVT